MFYTVASAILNRILLVKHSHSLANYGADRERLILFFYKCMFAIFMYPCRSEINISLEYKLRMPSGPVNRSLNEPCREKHCPKFGVSDQVRHKLGCLETEYDYKRIEMSDIGTRGFVLFM